MCTVTALKLAATGFRLACNRDERDERPAALPPRLSAFGGREAILPIDPQGGGTWIAVNDAGLALARLPPQAYAPFRLVLTDGAELAEIVSDGVGLRLRRGPLSERPRLFTSSSLGDAAVEGPRRALFDEMFARSGDPVGLQDSFHDHAWPGRPHLSVRMRRPGARTVSRTVVTVLGDAAGLDYFAEDAHAGAAPHHLALRRPRPAAA